jgi:hypothetical protein
VGPKAVDRLANWLMAVEVKTAPAIVAGEPCARFSADTLGTMLIPSRDRLQRRDDLSNTYWMMLNMTPA